MGSVLLILYYGCILKARPTVMLVTNLKVRKVDAASNEYSNATRSIGIERVGV